MIVVFPMLTSSTVSANILPGICKMLEKYIISHNLDLILDQVKTRKDIKRVGTSLKMKESVEIIEAPNTGPTGSKAKPKGGSKININLPKSGGKPGTATGDAPRIQQTIGLEPTWVKVDTPEGSNILGVKVVPTPVKSDDELIELLMKDQNLNKFHAMGMQLYRGAIKRAFRVWRMFASKLPFDLIADVSGDPKDDILFAKTRDKGNVLVCMNFGDIQDDDFIKSTGNVTKLFSLGWRSFILADDINKRAMFCLEQFKGMCSIIPYSFIYSSLGKDHKTVYDDLEDVRKSGGAIFRMKTNVRRAFGESIAQKKLDSYTFMNEQDLLYEDFKNLTSKMNANAVKTSMTTLDRIKKTGDKGALNRITSKLPSMDISKIDMVVGKVAPGFKKNKEFASRVLKNSLKDAGPAKIATASTILAMGASQSDKPEQALRTSLKAFVVKARKNKMNEAAPAIALKTAAPAIALKTAASTDKISAAGDAIKKGVDYVAGPAENQPNQVIEALKWINFAVDASVRALVKVASMATLTFTKLAELIMTSTKTKVITGIAFIVVILLLVLYLSRNE